MRPATTTACPGGEHSGDTEGEGTQEISSGFVRRRGEYVGFALSRKCRATGADLSTMTALNRMPVTLKLAPVLEGLCTRKGFNTNII